MHCPCACSIPPGEVQGVGGGSGGGPSYDVERMVEMDVPGGGTQTLALNFNIGDDPGTVARTFVTEHGLPMHNYEQVRVCARVSCV
jgi:hypothetical protein